ncbi:MAG: vitamin B12-dependent ribonucleotide reductase [Rhodospirillaceae bacterium]
MSAAKPTLSFTALLPPLPVSSTRDVVVSEGPIVKFRARGVQVPAPWSDTAASTLFRIWARRLPGCNGVQERWDERTKSLLSVTGYENSVYGMVERVVSTIGAEGVKGGYFDEHNRAVFCYELRSLFLNQYALLNTPAWINIGVTEKPQASACFIVGVGDSLASLRKWQDSETAIRPEGWPIAGGGMASGPVSFARGTDSWAGTIKSGGKSRRAAKILTLSVHHPDVRQFITAKRDAQRRAHALIDAGFPGNWQSDTWQHEPFQNSNLSVRVTDEFMRAVIDDTTYQLVWDGKVVEEPRAREIWDLICQCAWETGDPGLQYDTTINKWHTVPKAGRIVSSNPCSEFLHHNDTACNLASLNLLKFRKPDGSFDVPLFLHCVRLCIVAQEIICNFAGYPTPEIAENSRRFRPLGLGYCNLGALLMRSGMGYDSDEAREYAAAITALMGGEAYRVSAELAGIVGPFEGFAENREEMLAVLRLHRDNAMKLPGMAAPYEDAEDKVGSVEDIGIEASGIWGLALQEGKKHGFRNSQVTLLAPTGTIGMVMDADTTGVEPEYDLVTYKTLASGGIARRVSGSVREALTKLGCEETAIQRAVKAIEETGRIGGALDVDDRDRAVLATAAGEWPLAPEAHVRMMAAVQPFLSGGISKTVNLPKTATVEDVSDVYVLAWKEGVKCVALYRDGCKRSQPLNGGTSQAQPTPAPVAPTPAAQPQRRSLPNDRASASAHKLSLGGHDLYMHVGYFDDGMPGELFVRMAKVGTTESSLVDALCQAVSIGLQYGVPLEKYLDKWIGTRFEPSGFTGVEDIRSATSPLDLIAKKLRKLSEAPHEAARAALADLGKGKPQIYSKVHDLSPCCGATYKTTGSCKTCSACGATSGGCG